MFLDTGRAQASPLGAIPLENVGLHVTRFLARGWGAERERGVAECAAALRALCGLGRLDGWTREERAAFERWAPLVMSIPGVAGWPAADRRAIARVVRAKGGRRESDFVRAFDDHARLRRAIVTLSFGRAKIPAPPAAPRRGASGGRTTRTRRAR
jgi:hypothetical protein